MTSYVNYGAVIVTMAYAAVLIGVVVASILVYQRYSWLLGKRRMQ